MSRRPEVERRRRRRGHPFRAAFVGLWAAASVGGLVAVEGAFWRDAGYWMRSATAHAAQGAWMEALSDAGRARDRAPRDAGIAAFTGYAHGALGDWSAALPHFRRALRLDPDDTTEPALGLAEAHLSLGDTVAAVAALRGVDPYRARPEQRERATGLAEAGHVPEFAFWFLAVEDDPGTLRDRVRLAREAGEDRVALRLLDQAAADPARADDEWLALARAATLADVGRTSEAIVAYEGLLARGILRTDEEAVLRFAWLLSEEGRYAEARRVLDRGPSTARTTALATWAALWMDDLDDARRRVAGLAPDVPRELEDALRAAELRRSRARAEAEEARLAGTPPTNPEQALQFWLVRVDSDADDSSAREEAAALLEAEGRFLEARELLMDAPDPGAAALVRAARLSLWAGRPHEAVDLFDRLTTEHPDHDLSPGEVSVLAAAALDSGDAERAYLTLRSAGVGSEGRPPSVPALGSGAHEPLILLARAAEATGRASEGAAALRTLAGRRALTGDELTWLAGLLWRTGGLEGARHSYQAVAELRPHDPEPVRALGDLSMALGDPAGAERFYAAALERGGPGDPAGPARAYALSLLGRTEEAVAAYEAHLVTVPGDVPARLSLARALAGLGRFEDAAAELERATGGEADRALAGEIADLWIAANAWERAEPWARAAAVDGRLARIRHARVLLALDRHRAADVILTEIEGHQPERPADGQPGRPADARPTSSEAEDALVAAWLARLRNRPLRALRIAERPFPPGVDTTEAARTLRVLAAEVAAARGDPGRAEATLAAASRAGVASERTAHVSADLDRRRRATVTGGAEGGSDRNDLSVGTAWARLAARPWTGASPRLTLELRHREARQSGEDGSGTALWAGFDSLAPTPGLRLGLRGGFETGGGGGTRFVGGAEVALETEGGTLWDLTLARTPVWAEGAHQGAPEYARVRELATLDRGLMVSEAQFGFGSVPTSETRPSVRLEGGFARYSDDNTRGHGYGQLRVPVLVGRAGSLALTPNAYVEGFRDDRSAYASPSHFLGVGVAAEARRPFSWGSLDLRLNPHHFRYPGENGVGFEGQAWLGFGAGPGALRLGARYLEQGGVYDLFRLSTQFTLPLRSGP